MFSYMLDIQDHLYGVTSVNVYQTHLLPYTRSISQPLSLRLNCSLGCRSLFQIVGPHMRKLWQPNHVDRALGTTMSQVWYYSYIYLTSCYPLKATGCGYSYVQHINISNVFLHLCQPIVIAVITKIYQSRLLLAWQLHKKLRRHMVFSLMYTVILRTLCTCVSLQQAQVCCQATTINEISRSEL